MAGHYAAKIAEGAGPKQDFLSSQASAEYES